jgi:hypothetical protein
MSFRLAIGHYLVAKQAAEGSENPMPSSIVNPITIIVRRSGATSLKPW